MQTIQHEQVSKKKLTLRKLKAEEIKHISQLVKSIKSFRSTSLSFILQSNHLP